MYHSIFIPLLTDVEPVSAASAGYPEKAVLDQLYLLREPSATAASIAALSPEELLRSFPGVRFQKIVMSPAQDVWIYRLHRGDSRRAGSGD